MTIAIAQKIRRSFSDAAGHYDRLTIMHQHLGRKLVEKTDGTQPAVILDAGCGTGHVAAAVKLKFPQARVVGLDIAEGMLARAAQAYEDIEWMQGDFQDLPLQDNSVDMVISNLAYQWADDLKRTMSQAYRVLLPGGTLNASMFGSCTCRELLTLLNIPPALPTAGTVGKALSLAGFTHTTVESDIIEVSFPDVMALLVWLKNIGANQLGQENVFLGKQMLQRLEEQYRREYPHPSGITATFEVIWAYGKK